jgi:predicted TIM-barrel fold metal-dependent hydrolase
MFKFPLALFVLVCIALGGTNGRAQDQDNVLAGVIDFHCHSGPDIIGRLINDFELVRQCKAAGMRGIVLKNHYTMTADRAQLAMQEIGGIQVFGGITLNLSVGGLNAEAVRKMIQFDGRRGKIVWLPTFDAEAQVRASGENRPFVAVVKDGRPVPQLAEIFSLISEHNLVFETGHSSAAESLVLIDAAKKAGITRIVVTHAMSVAGGATDPQLQQMAQMGAIIEMTWLGQMSGAQTQPSTQPKITVAEYARVIKLIGADHVLISSDMGQMQNPPHPQAMRSFITELKKQGITDEQIDLIARKNPARLLGLD